jgi:rRNA maturation endonuclease Nob1
MLVLNDLSPTNQRVWLDGQEITHHIRSVEIVSVAGERPEVKILLGFRSSDVQVALAQPMITYVSHCVNCGKEFRAGFLGIRTLCDACGNL